MADITYDLQNGEQVDETIMLMIKTAINTKVSRTYAVTARAHGQPLTHNMGTLTGLSQADYFLKCEAYDTSGNLVGGITATKTSANACTINYADTGATFTGTLILELKPYDSL